MVAPFLSTRFAALGGLFVKAGQWLANMAATPLVWTDHLKKLQETPIKSISSDPQFFSRAVEDCAPKDTDTYVKAMLEAGFLASSQSIDLSTFNLANPVGIRNRLSLARTSRTPNSTPADAYKTLLVGT